MERKNGTGQSPAPITRNKSAQDNNIRIKRLCLGLILISVTGFLIAYYKGAENWMCVMAGVLMTSVVIETVLYPIEEGEDEDEDYC